jgi:hypothetical protein
MGNIIFLIVETFDPYRSAGLALDKVLRTPATGLVPWKTRADPSFERQIRLRCAAYGFEYLCLPSCHLFSPVLRKFIISFSLDPSIEG